MLDSTKKVAINGIGVALFVVLSLCLQVPVFENYYLCLGYIVMAVYTYNFGIFSGTLVGFLGTILYCLLISGLRGMPGWAAGNIIIGIFFGMAVKYSKNIKNIWLKRIICIAAIVISVAVGILGVKSFIEVLLYSQPFWLRITNNIYAFVADIVVLVLSIPFCELLAPRIQKFIE